jgi:UDP-N-acetylmuramoyl-L-alanyl-D-glutamate--2,6-diaminopimelate ligase
LSNYSKDDEVEIPIYNESAEANALNGAIKYGADYLIIEVNERTIEKGYVKNIPFDIRAITNIVPSHNTLLYTPEQYIAIKKSFFQNIPVEDECTCIYGLTNKDLFYEMISLNNNKYKTFASEYVAGLKGVQKSEINYMLHPVENKTFDTLDGLNFCVKLNGNSFEFKTPLIMPYNALNITLAIGIIDSLGELDIKTFQKVLENIVIPGRDEVFRIKGRTIIISITCTPHLEILKKYKEQGLVKNVKLITGSFGNGYSTWLPEFRGNQFSTYVSESMKWAYKYFINNCDYIYITANDNAASSIKELLDVQIKEVEGKVKYEAIEDRKETITKAIEESDEGDVIFISGRGNRKIFCSGEKEMQFFLDKDIVKNAFKKLKE